LLFGVMLLDVAFRLFILLCHCVDRSYQNYFPLFNCVGA
jgi:hypothetical protein